MSNLPVVVSINLCLQYAYTQCPVSCRMTYGLYFPQSPHRPYNDETVTFYVKDYRNKGQWKELTISGGTSYDGF